MLRGLWSCASRSTQCSISAVPRFNNSWRGLLRLAVKGLLVVVGEVQAHWRAGKSRQNIGVRKARRGQDAGRDLVGSLPRSKAARNSRISWSTSHRARGEESADRSGDVRLSIFGRCQSANSRPRSNLKFLILKLKFKLLVDSESITNRRRLEYRAGTAEPITQRHLVARTERPEPILGPQGQLPRGLPEVGPQNWTGY